MCMKNECDKLEDNKMVVTDFINMEQSMKDNHYEQVTKKQGGMQVVLEFPKKVENEDSIKQEVKSIMLSALHEYIDKIS